MRRLTSVFLTFVLLLAGCVPASAEENDAPDLSRRMNSFNEGWLFSCGEGDETASDPSFGDSTWEPVTLPHDWSICMAYDENGEAESGFLPGGTEWYRKKFVVPSSLKGKRISVVFDGVYQRAEVYLNGQKLGYHPDGYTSFSLDLSGGLIVDGSSENVLAVRVENPQPNSRWYSGSGIYRDVWLKVTDPVFVDEDATAIRYDVDQLKKQNSTETKASIVLCNDSDNDAEVTVHSVLRDPAGTAVGETSSQAVVQAKQTATVSQTIEARNLTLWSVDDPSQYTWEVAVSSSDGSDAVSIPFGYRYAEWDADHGFFLNGKAMKLQGVCLHQDYGALGTACYEAAVERQLGKLKRMGVNAIRSTHHAAGRILRTLCAQKGILLIEEGFDTYIYPKNGNVNDGSSFFLETVGSDNGVEHAYSDETWAEYISRRMVEESRNNPAVILYSIGNELLGNFSGDTQDYPQYAEEIITWIKDEDPDAVVTIGDNLAGRDNAVQLAMDQVLVDAGGAVGFNYAGGDVYDSMHAAYPGWCLYGSETASALSSRGWYSSPGVDEKNLQVSAYDTVHVGWGTTAQQAWKDVISRDFVGGEFIWTGWDYLGEPEPWNGLDPGSVSGQGASPKSSYFGVVDTAGFEKDTYYFYMSQWNPDVVTLHILPDWNVEDIARDKLGRVKVDVYSNAASVELFRNGMSLGRKYFAKQTTEDGYTYQTCEGELYLSWDVWYWPGEITAKAYDEDGNEITDTVGRSSVKTSSAAAQVVLTADRSELRADGSDLAFITAEIRDEDGNPVYGASVDLNFTLEGEGRIIGVDNGDPTDLSSYQGSDESHASRRTFSGKALIIVQTSKTAGTIRVSASGEGLASSVIEINSAAP